MTIKRVKLDTLSDKQTLDARMQAAAILQAELKRASDSEVELRWEPIRAALTILTIGPIMWTEIEPLF